MVVFSQKRLGDLYLFISPNQCTDSTLAVSWLVDCSAELRNYISLLSLSFFSVIPVHLCSRCIQLQDTCNFFPRAETF